MPALTGYAPTDRLMALYLGADGSAPATTVGYGTQAAPLDSFSVDGRSGNKTTNKDLPEWLRKLGMKGDAYAGGMLKPQIRYGFWYKNGKINFADGTSFDAKKNKDGTFSYTDAAGKAATYSPTDEQYAYNKAYKASTSNQSFLDKATNAVKFELDHGAQIIKGAWDHPQQFVFGIDPLGTKIGNAVTGDNAKPQVDQLGGALDSRYADYTARTGRETGFAKPLQGVAHVIAGLYGAKGLSRVGGQLASRIGNAPTGGDLGVFSNGGQAGMAGVGSGNAGALAASGGVGGGAGIGGTTAGALGGGIGSGAGMAGGTGAAGFSWTDWIPSLVSAGASIIGGNQARGATDAAARAALAENARQFDLVRGDTAPVRALGNAAVGTLADLQGFNDSGTPNLSRFYTSPDYQFRLDQGQQAIDRSAAARGGLLSGAAVKEGIRFNSGTAAAEYGSFVDRLMQQAGLGSNGTAQSAAAGANSASNSANINMNAGNSRASSYIDTAANINNSLQAGYGNYMLRRYLGG